MTNNGMEIKIHKLSRSGITLIEVLVVITVISIVIGISIPAVQSARAAARRIDCQNRVRQITLAIGNFCDRHEHLPSNGGSPEILPSSLSYKDKAGNPFIPSTTDLLDFAYYPWGMGDPREESHRQTGSWAYSILAELEQGSAIEADDPEVTLPQFHCPSRNHSLALPTADDNQGLYRDGGYAMSKTDYCMNDLIATPRPAVQKWHLISDGLSQTLFVGEKAIDPTVQTSTSWYWDEPVWIGGSKGTARSGDLILPDAVGIPFRHNWGSSHSGGANFGFGDGSVRFVSQSTDATVVRAWITPNGNDLVKPEP